MAAIWTVSVLVLSLASSASGYVHSSPRNRGMVRTPRSMRSRQIIAAMRTNETASSGVLGLLGINRDSPEAKANQLAWAREQMNAEVRQQPLSAVQHRELQLSRSRMAHPAPVRTRQCSLLKPCPGRAQMPEQTVDGQSIEGRDDFVQQYIASEKEKFGRDVDLATAEREVDAWLLKQATAAPSKMGAGDVAAAVLVFVVAFGASLYFS